MYLRSDASVSPRSHKRLVARVISPLSLAIALAVLTASDYSLAGGIGGQPTPGASGKPSEDQSAGPTEERAVAGPEAEAKLSSGIDLENFSKSVSAKTDFYEFVNGEWLAKTEIPADRSNYGSFTVLADRSEEALRKIIEQAAQRDDLQPGSDDQKVGDYYKSFMDIERLDSLGLKPLSGLLDEVRQAASKADLVALMAKSPARAISSPIGLFVSIDQKQSDRYAVYLSQSGTTLPDRDYYLKDDPQYQQVREKFVEYVAALLKAAGYGSPDEAARRILALETRLAEAQWTKVENRDPDKTYNKRNGQEVGEALGPFDWAQFAAAVGVADQGYFVVRQPSYFEAFGKTWESTPLETWKDYFFFRTLDAHATSLSSEFDQLHFGFHQQVLSGVSEPSPRWKRAIQSLNIVLGEVLGKIYVREYFRPEAKQRMEQLVENLKRAFAERIEQLDWMGPATKQKALDKLSKFRTKIGYPDKWKDYTTLEIRADDLLGNDLRYAAFEHQDMMDKLGEPVDREEWHMTPQTVNAYYSATMNEIVFPAAILQPPFFNMEADDAVNYAAIGAVIGHELSHGFDDKGSKFDGDGNLLNWWTVEDRREFEKRAERLVEQYSSYEVFPGMFVNGEFTLGENIGDLGGLNVAYTAYRFSLNGQSAPKIDGYSGDQRFFLGWSQIWRRKYREPELRKRLLADPHSPSRYRVIGIVSNMDAFYKAFDIQPGDAMYIPPEKRVRIW